MGAKGIEEVKKKCTKDYGFGTDGKGWLAPEKNTKNIIWIKSRILNIRGRRLTLLRDEGLEIH